MEKTARPSLMGAIVFWVASTVLWLVFAAVLLLDSSRLVDVWQSVRDLPLLIEGLVWLLFLPWIIGLWIWQWDWSSALRLVLIAMLAVGMTFAFFPRRR